MLGLVVCGVLRLFLVGVAGLDLCGCFLVVEGQFVVVCYLTVDALIVHNVA